MKNNYFLILLCCFSIILSEPALAGIAPQPVVSNINAFLPARVFYFDVVQQNGKDLLKWEATANSDLTQFQIEYSTDNIHFLAVDSIYPKLVSSDAASYEFYSPYMITGTRYYRLKLIYNNGDFEYTPVVSMDDAINNRVIVSYLNTKQFQLTIPYFLHSINILNASGQVLIRYTDVPAGTQIINMNNFAAGIYWIQCLSSKNEVLKIMNG